MDGLRNAVHERGPEDDRAAVSLADSPTETDPLVKGGLHATCEPRASPNSMG